jgi:hypothetical protein
MAAVFRVPLALVVYSLPDGYGWGVRFAIPLMVWFALAHGRSVINRTLRPP